MRFEAFRFMLLAGSLLCLFWTGTGSARASAYMLHDLSTLQDGGGAGDVTLVNDTIRILFPHHLTFDRGQASVRAEFIPVMKRLADVLTQYPETELLLVGHTDDRGSAAHNLELSRRRADTARNMLERFGVSTARLSSWGIGSSLPVAENNTEAGRQQNRRVEFIVLYNYRSATQAP